VTAVTRRGLTSTVHELDDESAAGDYCAGRGWTDGLPVVAPTAERVWAMLEWTGSDPAQVLGVEPVRGRVLTAEQVAVNSVLAGCTPRHFPVVAAAVEAMCKPEFLLHGATSSTGGCAVLLVVNGPVAAELGMTGTFDVLGAGDAAGNVIGRAVRLVLRNLLDVRPGQADRSTLGHPGKLSWCLAEDEAGSPWPSVAEARGLPAGTPAVTVLAAGAPRQVMNEWTTQPTEVLETFAAEMRANMLHYSIWAGNYAVALPPQLRAVLVGAGWDRDDIARFLHERAAVQRGQWADVGKGAVVDDGNRHDTYRALASPQDLLLIAAGGPAGGFGAVIPPWFGHKSRAVTVPVGVCVDC
jgi:hypothetical protein